jgi:D-glycero-D-manno-heptose 1,7-bisphosphate phosphatase
MMRRAVFLDRDGVINRPVVHGHRPHPPRSLAELELLPRVPQALQALKTAGYALVVVTNQPEIARGTTASSLVNAINDRLQAMLPLEAVLTCPHDNSDRCACRKPQPGLILSAAGELRIDRAASYMIGDRWRDVEAGRRAGCKTIFVDYGYDEPVPAAFDFRVRSLLEAAGIILRTGISP